MDKALVDLIVQEVSRRIGPAATPRSPVPEIWDAEEDCQRWRFSVLSNSGNDCLSDITAYDIKEKTFVRDPADPEYLRQLKKSTPARIGLGRAGPRYLTIPWLRFRADHAQAMDAVFSDVPAAFAEELGLVCAQTECSSKEEYLQRPDLGRRLSGQARAVLEGRCEHGMQVQVVVADGLSSSAILGNARDFLSSLRQGLSHEGLREGTPVFVRYGRVAVMNDIGEVLRPEVVVEIIGERPGLVTARSMSSYMCYRPGAKTVESDMSMVANIHSGGFPPVEAGAHVASMVKQIITARASGIKLTTGGAG
ncbi:MAG: ethanolamine ammonia-lyase subunit EutC [Firmicutes bacterium]|nr:ethanolamine ammonia-lyase subunit EutC [Bacillota bacterium]